MKEIKESCYKGTRILLGDKKRRFINQSIEHLQYEGFVEISIPIIQYQEMFTNKVGEENNNMMFNFKDRGDRDICLAPEYTAVIQRLAKTYFNSQRDLKVFYVQECFRGERPQKGRYRQFTQLGVEIINPRHPINNYEYMVQLAEALLPHQGNYIINKNTPRGLDYYTGGKGFEISENSLGTQKQICGGGEYDGGIGFAIGVDRVLELI